MKTSFHQTICQFHMDLKSTQTLVANVPALSCNENNNIISYPIIHDFIRQFSGAHFVNFACDSCSFMLNMND